MIPRPCAAPPPALLAHAAHMLRFHGMRLSLERGLVCKPTDRRMPPPTEGTPQSMPGRIMSKLGAQDSSTFSQHP
jgi:hypothetical protein